MFLIQDKNWKAVHFVNGTVFRVDRNRYTKSTWELLVKRVNVEPMAQKGHYKAIAK